MNKILILIFSLVASGINAQTATKITWDYPVKPGMEEWRQLKTFEEINQACQIPEDMLKKLDTEALVKICFDYPDFMTIFLYNTPQDGFNALYSSFNGIRELFDRKDAGHFMLKKYKSMTFADFNPLWTSATQGEFVFKYQYFETLLAQPQVFQSLDTNGRKELLKESTKKFEMKLSNRDLFGGDTFAVNVWIMARTLHYDSRLSSKFSDPADIELSLMSGHLVGYDLMSIYEQSKKYVDEK